MTTSLFHRTIVGWAIVAWSTGTHAQPTDTYQQTCELPRFDWAAYGTRVTGRLYTRRAAVLGDHLYAAGYLKSTNAPNEPNFVDIDTDFGVSGPYTTVDPIGETARAITADLVSYTTEHGSFAQYEVGVVKIDRTYQQNVRVLDNAGRTHSPTYVFVFSFRSLQ